MEAREEVDDVDDVDDLLTRGEMLNAQQQYAEALPLFERATQLASSSFDAWANLGYILNELGRYQEALAAYGRALTLDPSYAIAWYNKGAVFGKLGRYQRALPGGIGRICSCAGARPELRQRLEQ